MNGFIAWIAAEAERPEGGADGAPLATRTPQHSFAHLPVKKFSTQLLLSHQFPSSAEVGREGDAERVEEEQAPILDDPLDRNPDLRTYRAVTVAMLRRYLRYSLETGRLPSLLGSEFFRTRVTSYSVVTFEDRVIFVHDMEICIERLGEFSRQIIARHVLQEHDCWQTARLLRCNEKTIRRNIPLALDQLSEILLEVGVIEKLDPKRKKSCQEGKNDEFLASDCADGK